MNRIIEEDARKVAESKFINWDKISGKTVLITGATGFIGSCLINSLMYRNIHMNDNIKIIALVRNLSKATTQFLEFKNSAFLEFLVGDILSVPSYDGNIDYIIHCASNASPKDYSEDPVGTMAINFIGTYSMLELGKKKNISKFLYASTIEIYGHTNNESKIIENNYGCINPLLDRSCYPLSKKNSETLCICFSKQYNLDVSIGRLSYIFGAGMKKNDSKVVSILARSAAKGENLILKSLGLQNRSYTYISDAISALLTILLNGKNCEAYNIASSNCETTIANIGKELEELYKDDGSKLIFDISENSKQDSSQIQNAILSNEKLKQLGWTENIDLKSGLIRMVTSIREEDNYNNHIN